MHTPSRILVVDDDAELRRTLAELLEEEGYVVSCAENGAEALAQLDGGAAPSLILLDLSMPVMDGYRFREAQRERPDLARVPTVVLSANAAADPAAIEALRVDAYLAKPFDLDRLMRTVEQLC